MWPSLFATVVFSVLLSATSTACPKFSEWADATTHLGGPIVCAKIYSSDDCNGFPLLFGVNSSVPDLKHTMSIMSLSTAFALIRPGCRLHIWTEPNYGGKKVDNVKRSSWHIGDAVKASATCDCMTNAADILTCKPEAKWSLVKRCDFSGSLGGGKCVYPSKLGFRFTSTAGAISENDKRAMSAVVHETFGYGKDEEIDFEENSGTEEQFSSVDVGAGKNVSVYQVTSPNYPNHYGANVRQAYILNARTPNGRVKLHISMFDTENCCDKLLVLDGNFGRPWEVISGELGRVNLEYRSTGPVMVLFFQTDGTVSNRGWSAHFSTEYD